MLARLVSHPNPSIVAMLDEPVIALTIFVQ
jgi:hypothetical protein